MMSKKGLKMATADNLNEKLEQLNTLITKLNKEVEGLTNEVADLKKKAPGEAAKASNGASGKGDENKEPDPDLADLLALVSLCGFVPFSFGAPALLPLGLRIGAARTIALGRALERAASASSELAKTRDGGTGAADLMQHLFKAMLSQTPDERRILVETLRRFWQSARTE